MIYEARPNVTVDATGLALKSGNAIVLKGGSSAIHSNTAIVSGMHQALETTNIPRDAVQFIESTDRSATKQLFKMKEHIDVLIPGEAGPSFRKSLRTQPFRSLKRESATATSILTGKRTLKKRSMS